jgi:hypothetical protein
MDEVGPIRTLIGGSSVITVIYIPVPVSAAGVSVSCRASTTVEVDAKNVPKEIRTTSEAKMIR